MVLASKKDMSFFLNSRMFLSASAPDIFPLSSYGAMDVLMY
jgi:hypothetical protein